jgi:hypothetical protein
MNFYKIRSKSTGFFFDRFNYYAKQDPKNPAIVWSQKRGKLFHTEKQIQRYLKLLFEIAEDLEVVILEVLPEKNQNALDFLGENFHVKHLLKIKL